MRDPTNIQDGYSRGSVQLAKESLPQGVLPATIHEQGEEEDEEETDPARLTTSQPLPEAPDEPPQQPPETPDETPQDNLTGIVELLIQQNLSNTSDVTPDSGEAGDLVPMNSDDSFFCPSETVQTSSQTEN